MGRRRQRADGRAVDDLRKVLFFLRFVHGRVSRRVDDHVGSNVLHDIREAVGPQQVAPRTIASDDLAERHQAANQFPSHLAVGARHHQPHAKTSASRNGRPAASFGERTGSPCSGHAIPISGSLQATQRSCSGA